MIRWCAYCQNFLGERAPYDDPSFTHSVCSACDLRLERDEPLKKDTERVRALFKRLLIAGKAGAEAECASLVGEAQSLGLGNESTLIGLLQPALYQAGLEWQLSGLTVTEEHGLVRTSVHADHSRPTFSRTTRRAHLSNPGELTHHWAAHGRRSPFCRGVCADAIVPGIPVTEMLDLVRQRRPRLVGFSCALPRDVQVAREHVAKLRSQLEPSLVPRFLLSGFAFRLSGDTLPLETGSDVEVVRDLESFPWP